MSTECFNCSMNAQAQSLPPREAIVVEPPWRVAHAFDSALPGWLVLLPDRHVVSLDELSEEEVAPLGSLLRRCSLALREVTGCEKSYVMFFAEAENFAHVHIHVVPRLESFTPQQLGPGVFDFLSRPAQDQLSESQRDEIAIRLRAAWVVAP